MKSCLFFPLAWTRFVFLSMLYSKCPRTCSLSSFLGGGGQVMLNENLKSLVCYFVIGSKVGNNITLANVVFLKTIW